jgi:hypothetical protein
LVTVVDGVAETAMAKSGAGGVTVSKNVCVLGAGAPAAIAESVTFSGPPCGVEVAAVTVKVTVTGEEEVGDTVLEGEKVHAAPVGNPAGQARVTMSAKLPEAVTWNVAVDDVPPWPTVSEFGLGAVKLKSTT